MNDLSSNQEQDIAITSLLGSRPLVLIAKHTLSAGKQRSQIGFDFRGLEEISESYLSDFQ